VLHFDALPESTAELFRRLLTLEEAQGFTLIGGTALALQTKHRESEDLDLAWTQGRLPQRQIEKLLKSLARDIQPKLITDQAALLDAENDGFDLNETQQDWQIGRVKVTFFAPFSQAQLDVYDRAHPLQLEQIKILDPDSVFALKSSLVLDRKTSRDLYDLWFFLDRRDRSIEDILTAMDERKRHLSTDHLLDRLSPTTFQLTDPGFKALLPNAPQDKESLLTAMREKVDEYRADLAYELALAARQRDKGPSR
jgi:predicted nucleotidyltransferase component of viral defense system